MESPSTPTHRRLFSWPGLLLTVSLFIFWSPLTSAQFGIVSTNTGEGDNTILFIHKKPPNNKGFVWYRGKGKSISSRIAIISLKPGLYVLGPAHSGREKLLRDGSLMIQNVTLEDMGYYTIEAFLKDSKKKVGFGWLHVYQPVRMPTLLTSNTTVTENMNAVVLTCDTNAISIQWLFNGTRLQLRERMKLSWCNRTLTIDPVRREDAGGYQCEVSNPISRLKSAPIKLDVKFV